MTDAKGPLTVSKLSARTSNRTQPRAKPRPSSPPASTETQKDAASGRPSAAAVARSISEILSDFEFTLIIVMYGFSRWVETCMAAANVRGLSTLDILVLHAVNHRARDRRLPEICMVLNIDESHLVAYALKKLVAGGLVSFRTKGREHQYLTTHKGDEACLAYRRVREEFLVKSLSWVSDGGADLVRIETLLRTMSGLYDQAGRFATAASIGQPKAPPVHTKR